MSPSLQAEHDRIMAKVTHSLNRRCGQLRRVNREQCDRFSLWVDAALAGVIGGQRARQWARERGR